MSGSVRRVLLTTAVALLGVLSAAVTYALLVVIGR
jgi:hypothetical protein